VPVIPPAFDPCEGKKTTVDFLGWMRSTEDAGSVPGARIPNQAPPDGVFNGWHFEWAREFTPIQYFENDRIRQAAMSGEYTKEIFGLPESIYDRNLTTGFDYVWDGGSGHQFYTGYYDGDAPGGWASWGDPDIPTNLYSPETMVDTPGVYGPFHYSLRRFTAYVNITCLKNIKQAYLESQYPPEPNGDYAFPLNDSAFVFVNGKLAYWSSTDISGSQTTNPIRHTFYNVVGTPMPQDMRYVFTDGWYLPIAGHNHLGNIDPLLREGKNVIDIIADDFYSGGGMSRLKLVTA
jgi:hypothetical protein